MVRPSISSWPKGDLTLALFALACSGSQAPEPAWAPSSAPPYPEAAGAKSPVEVAPPSESTSVQAARPSLAEAYGSRPALETFSGKATYYADSLAGNRTASGAPYDPTQHSAAHRKLPFGTVVRVIRRDTGAATYVRVNDRGPFGGKDRVIDVSRAAAEDLEMLRAGVVPVRVEVVHRPE